MSLNISAVLYGLNFKEKAFQFRSKKVHKTLIQSNPPLSCLFKLNWIVLFNEHNGYSKEQCYYTKNVELQWHTSMMFAKLTQQKNVLKHAIAKIYFAYYSENVFVYLRNKDFLFYFNLLLIWKYKQVRFQSTKQNKPWLWLALSHYLNWMLILNSHYLQHVLLATN